MLFFLFINFYEYIINKNLKEKLNKFDELNLDFKKLSIKMTDLLIKNELNKSI